MLLYIQVLRACAALAIAIHHAQFDAGAIAARLGGQFQPLDRIPWAAGVDVFFVISGFIIVYSSQKLFGSPGAGRVFLVRRLGRVVPLYWTVTSLYLAVALALPGILNSEVLEPGFILASYLFIPLERPDGAVQPLYTLGWTLNYEMYFYVLFALTLAWPKRTSIGMLIGVLLAATVVGGVVSLPQPLDFWTSPIILEFAFGVALAHLKDQGLVLPRGVRAAFAIGGLALLLAGANASLPRPVAYGVPAAFFVAAAALGAERVRPETWLGRIGNALGDASYALYLVHPFVIRASREIVLRTGLGPVIGTWGYVALVLAGAVLASLLVFRWYERPMTQWFRRRSEPGRLKLA
ncbi:acyltransferase family protein [Microvirga sp. TS319]|uniref:acyltransferase family protein n=1 Tax=Microvirga sp. TS319 TaxID=3241165 RepID=UPI00351A50AC